MATAATPANPISPEEYAFLQLSGLFSDDELQAMMLAEAVDMQEAIPYHKRYNKFDLELFSNEECKQYFRFAKQDLFNLCDMLVMPPEYTSKLRLCWSNVEGLCTLLRRLAYPNRLSDMVPLFGRSVSQLSDVVNVTMANLFLRHAHLLTTVSQNWLNHEQYTQAVFAKGAALDNIWGFIDRMVRRTCKPKFGQRDLFSGHKRYHCLKYQHVMLPNGIIAHSFGPFHGRHNDAAMYRESALDGLISTIRDTQGRQLALYGDGGYGACPWLLTPFRRTQITTAERQAFNTMMSNSCIAVEWGFGKVSTLFAFVNFYHNQKVFLQNFGQYFLMATIFANLHTCMYGSEISSYFGLDPPSAQEYLAG